MNLDKPKNVLTEEQYRVLADRMIEEHRKYGDRLRDGHWAEIAARKVVSHLADFGIGAPAAASSDERPWMNEWQRNMSKKSKGLLIRMIEEERAECDRLRNEAPAAGLTAEDVMEVVGEWKQNGLRGCIEQHEEVEALSPENGIGWVLLSDLRTRLTAAIEQKNSKP